jgi:glycosyltransferase involved in cell wall biosynthesis
VSLIVTISEALAKEFSRTFPSFPAHRILVAHDGANEHKNLTTPSSASLSRSRGNPVKIGYVGSLRPGKGMELIPQLATLMPEVDFHIVGGTDEQVREWRIRADNPNITFHGFASPSDAEMWIDQFDILLAPYQPVVLTGDDNIDISRWMSPLKIFEYMKSGKPIVASDLPVLREVLEHGRNALLVEATNPNAWRKQISCLLVDDHFRAKICMNAFEDFRTKYTWEKRAELIIRHLT